MIRYCRTTLRSQIHRVELRFFLLVFHWRANDKAVLFFKCKISLTAKRWPALINRCRASGRLWRRCRLCAAEAFIDAVFLCGLFIQPNAHSSIQRYFLSKGNLFRRFIWSRPQCLHYKLFFLFFRSHFPLTEDFFSDGLKMTLTWPFLIDFFKAGVPN